MVSSPETNQQLLSAHDLEEVTKMVNAVALSEKSRTLFAIAPDSGPSHPVTKAFAAQLKHLVDEPLQFCTFFYSDNSLFNFLAKLDAQAPLNAGRRIVFAFGLDQLPKPRLKQELDQLNLGREKIFEQNLVLVFWLNRERFLDDFRDRAPDFWDWRGQVALFEQRHPFLYPYLEWLIAEHSYLTMSGIMQVNRQVDIFLDQIYVSLQAEHRQQVTVTSKRQQVSASKVIVQRQFGRKEAALEPDSVSEPALEMERTELEVETGSTKTVTEKVDLADVVRGPYACSVILGAPGAGKTTLLKHLALQFAKARRDNQDTVQGGTKKESLGQPRWPIYLRIADYAERLESHPELSILDYLKRFYRGWEEHFDSGDVLDLVTPLLHRMEQGQCLILLDGLDEVFDQESRRKIVGCINQFAEEFSHNKLIVTSRIAGYQEVKLASRFTEFTITDMTDDEVSEFLHRWCRAVEQAQKSEATQEQQERVGDQQAEQILSDIQRNEGVRRLTANPLLLTILALIHRNGERLPERRVKLYELAVQTLTADWQLSKKLPNAQKVLLPEGEVVELLAPLAYWMHEEKPSGQVTHAEVIEQLAPRLAELRGEAPDSPEILAAVEEFLRRVRETTGLFVERAPDIYGFMHLTFEEYFAARFIADHETNVVLKIIQSKISDPRWKEPILLAIGFLNDYFPKRSRILVKKLFGDLIQLGDRVSAKQKYIPLEGIKLKLYKREVNLLKQKSKSLLNKINLNLCQLSLFLAYLPSILLSGIWIAKYVIVLCCDLNHSSKKIVLAFQISYDVELNNRHRFQLLRGVIVSILIMNWLIPYIPQKDALQRKYLGFFSKLEDLKDFTLSFADETARISKHSSFLKYFTARELQEFSNSLSVPEGFTVGAQKLFFEITVACDSSDDAMQLLNLRLPAKHQALAYRFAGNAYKKKKQFEKAIAFYQQSREIYQQLGKKYNVANRYSQISTCYKELSRYRQATECQQKVLEIRKNSKKNRQRIAYTHFQLGRIYHAWGKYEEAIRYFEQSRDLYQQLKKKSDVANQWYWVADCYRKWGKYEQALAAEQQNLAIRKKLNDQPSIADAYFQLGYIYQGWGKYKQAICYHERSRDLYQQIEDDSNVADQWSWIAGCYYGWDHYKQALAAQQESLAIRQRLSDQADISLSYYQLGRIYQGWGKYEQATHYFEQSRDLYQQLEKESDVADLWYWLANCYREWGKYEQALAAEQEDLNICQKLDDRSNTAEAYYQMGRIHQAWDKYEDAVRYFEQSRDLYQQLEKESDVADQWSHIAGCYYYWGCYEQALATQQQALTIYQKVGNQSDVSLVYFRLGLIYQAWGRYEESVRYFEQSRDLCQQLGKNSNVATMWSRIADCYCEWGHYEQALAAQQEALAIRQKLGNPSDIALTSYQLGRIYRTWGKYAEAIRFYEQSCDLYQQLEKESDVADLWYWLANCYRELKDYSTTIGYYQKSFEQHYSISDFKSAAKRLRHLAYTQILYSTKSEPAEVVDILQQANQNLQQAIQLNIAGDYRKSLAYDYIIKALLIAEQLRELPPDNNSIPDHIAQFEQAAAEGFARFTELGRAVSSAKEALKIARAYLEIESLWKLDKAEDLTQQSLQTFQKFNRRKLQAAANKLLGEIYLARAHKQEPDADIKAKEFLTVSLSLYQELDIPSKSTEVEQLLHKNQ